MRAFSWRNTRLRHHIVLGPVRTCREINKRNPLFQTIEDRYPCVLLFATLLAACGFDPKPNNGVVPCSAGCPSGYACAADNTCWSNGSGWSPMKTDGSLGTTGSGGGTIPRTGTGSGGSTAYGSVTSMGGMMGYGGVTSLGGTTSNGGTMGYGGATSRGGTTSSGGVMGYGGVTGKGGTPGNGGMANGGRTTGSGGSGGSGVIAASSGGLAGGRGGAGGAAGAGGTTASSSGTAGSTGGNDAGVDACTGSSGTTYHLHNYGSICKAMYYTTEAQLTSGSSTSTIAYGDVADIYVPLGTTQSFSVLCCTLPPPAVGSCTMGVTLTSDNCKSPQTGEAAGVYCYCTNTSSLMLSGNGCAEQTVSICPTLIPR
jgi:hypothetical protein